MTPQPQNPKADSADVSSPIWGKQSARKERRATKRLEADRKELEKRLLKLEESQSKLDQGIYDRSGRRLTKKQPEGSSSRSSSAGSSRFRSSSIGAFFSRSRRNSRASSINDEDQTNPKQTDASGPPSLPLALNERFGADVSRELSTRHGPLVSSSQHTLKSASGMSQQSQQPQRSLHAAPKSDDLRENWRMAEEWQKKNSSRELGTEDIARRLEALAGASAMRQGRDSPRTTERSPRQLPANMKSHKSLFKPTTSKRSTDPSRADPSTLSIESIPRDTSASDNIMAHDRTLSLVTASELRGISNSIDEKDFGSYGTESTGLSQAKSDRALFVSSERAGQEAALHAPSRQYKSSPLTMNPHTPEDSNFTSNDNSTNFANQAQIPQPLRIVKPSQPDDPQERRRQATQSWPGATQDEKRQHISIAQPDSSNTHQQANGGERSRRGDILKQPYSRVIPPRKHPGRRSLDGSPPKGNIHDPTVFVSDVAPGSTRYKDKNPSNMNGTAAAGAVVEGSDDLEHPRPSSSHSSQGASSYDTADEEVIDVPSKQKQPGTSQQEKAIQASKNRAAPVTGNASSGMSSPTNIRHNPLAPVGPLSMLRRKPMQKVKPPRAEDLVAKLFVICCQCKYWHDMPSEVYAKLTSPERVPSESRLVRNFSRRNSIRKAIFASDPNDPRRMPLPPRGQPQDGPSGSRGPSGDGTPKASSQTAPPYRHQCCWCGHSMSKTCCQGWTALVHMRERYH